MLMQLYGQTFFVVLLICNALKLKGDGDKGSPEGCGEVLRELKCLTCCIQWGWLWVGLPPACCPGLTGPNHKMNPAETALGTGRRACIWKETQETSIQDFHYGTDVNSLTALWVGHMAKIIVYTILRSREAFHGVELITVITANIFIM